MKGVILGFDKTNGGLIRADDGKRYTLPADAWRGLGLPVLGQQVDFEVDGDAAREVYPLVTETESIQDDLAKNLSSVAEASQQLPDLQSHPVPQQALGIGKRISASLFALILVCFLLPFVTVSCDNRPILQMSGLEMITGKTVSAPTFTGQTQSQKIPGDQKAALIFAAAAVGIGSSLIKFRKSHLISTGIGAFGLLMLLSIKSGIDKEMIDKGAGYAGFKADYGLGFWGSSVLFVSAACLNIWLFFQKKTNTKNNN